MNPLISIVKADEKDSKLLADIGRISFIESHGHCAKAEDVNAYINNIYIDEVFKEELGDPGNIYHIIYHNDQPAGYSKVIFNAPQANIAAQNITKLERLYLVKEFYGSGAGADLFNYNLELSKNNNQAGMWLYVWKENHRAISFYKKNGFKVIGSYDFIIAPTHSNPNHQMFLEY